MMMTNFRIHYLVVFVSFFLTSTYCFAQTTQSFSVVERSGDIFVREDVPPLIDGVAEYIQGANAGQVGVSMPFFADALSTLPFQDHQACNYQGDGIPIDTFRWKLIHPITGKEVARFFHCVYFDLSAPIDTDAYGLKLRDGTFLTLMPQP